MPVQLKEKVITTVIDTRDLSIIECFGFMAMDSVRHPGLRDVVAVLGNGYVMQCSPSLKEVCIYNTSSYQVTFSPLEEKGIQITYECLSSDLNFIAESGAVRSVITTYWDIDQILDLGVVD